MPTYSADQIINKTLIAKTEVPIKRYAEDDAAAVYTAKPGQTVGVVYSYVLPTVGRSSLYWQFMDANGRPYYAEHKEGRFDIKELKAQGAMTVQEQTEAQQRANETLGDTLQRYAKYILIGGAALFGLNIILKNKPWEKA